MSYRESNKESTNATYYYNLKSPKSKNLILLFSKSPLLKELCRNLLNKYNDLDILVLRDYRGIAKEKDARVIFLDEEIESRETILKDIIFLKKQYNIPIVVITENHDHNIMKEYHSKGIEFVLTKPVDVSLLDSTLIKILSQFKENVDLIKDYHGITLNLTFEFATYKGCKILLNTLETLILDALMDNFSHVSAETLQDIIFTEIEKEVSFTHIRTTISRLRKKFKECTGINIIRNRHSKGYSISV